MDVSKHRGRPQNGWFIMDIPIKMDDLGYHYFWKHPIIYYFIEAANNRDARISYFNGRDFQPISAIMLASGVML